jgi:plastocyanin
MIRRKQRAIRAAAQARVGSMNPRRTLRSTPLDTIDVLSFTFTTAGTFPHHCRLHPHMVGKVVSGP